MFKWLRRREGKRIVAERAEPEPVDPIAELLRLAGDDHPQQPKNKREKTTLASSTRARLRPRGLRQNEHK